MSNDAELRKLIDSCFNEPELIALCSDLNFDYENLPGQGKSAKVVELIRAFNRIGRLPDLIAYCRQERPNAPWCGVKDPIVALAPPPMPAHKEPIVALEPTPAHKEPIVVLEPTPARRRGCFWVLAVLALVGVLAIVFFRGCDPPPDRFPVSVTNRFEPTGLMGDIDDITVAKIAKEESPSFGTAVHFTYVTTGEGAHEWDYKYINGLLNSKPAYFGGVMMLDQPGNFGTEPSGGVDLSGAKSISWKACTRGDPVTADFFIGGATWIWDEATGEKVNAPYPDSLRHHSLGTRTVSARCDSDQYDSFVQDLTDYPQDEFRRVVNGFGWLVSWSANGVTLKDDRTGPAEARTLELEITDIWYDDK